jgi:hypothetical protein
VDRNVGIQARIAWVEAMRPVAAADGHARSAPTTAPAARRGPLGIRA